MLPWCFDMGQTGRMVWSLKQAAAACGVSVDTVKRRLKALEAAGAYKDQSGAWRVTPDQLRAVGLQPGAPKKSARAKHQGSTGAGEPVALVLPGTESDADALRRRVQELETALTVERVKREAAETLATERNRTIEVLSTSLRMLEAGPTREPGADQEPADEPEQDALPLQEDPTPDPEPVPAAPSGWWSRLLGR